MSHKVSATLHQHWLDGRIGNFGGFQTKQFAAYTEADSNNKRKLQGAFPEWFLEECEIEKTKWEIRLEGDPYTVDTESVCGSYTLYKNGVAVEELICATDTEAKDYTEYCNAKYEIGEEPLSLDQWREFNGIMKERKHEKNPFPIIPIGDNIYWYKGQQIEIGQEQRGLNKGKWWFIINGHKDDINDTTLSDAMYSSRESAFAKAKQFVEETADQSEWYNNPPEELKDK